MPGNAGMDTDMTDEQPKTLVPPTPVAVIEPIDPVAKRKERRDAITLGFGLALLFFMLTLGAGMINAMTDYPIDSDHILYPGLACILLTIVIPLYMQRYLVMLGALLFVGLCLIMAGILEFIFILQW